MYDPSNPYYDLAGNMLCSGTQTELNAKQYVWDAESRLLQVNSQRNGNAYAKAATYTYDGSGNRGFSHSFDLATGSATGFRMYANYKGDLLWEQNGGPGQPTTWTDYVYALGRRIARVEAARPVLHLRGDRTNAAANAGVEGVVANVPAGVVGMVVRQGDRLMVDERQDVVTFGGMTLFTQGDTVCICSAQDETSGMNPFVNSFGDGQWHHFSVNLSAWAGQTVSRVEAGIHNGTPSSGTFDLQFANASIVRADGTILPIYTGQPASVQWFYPGSPQGGALNMSSQTETTGTTPADNSGQGVTYFLGDHLGTTQLEVAGTGTPTWKGEFAPFGQELTNQATQNRFKFTGKERDAESGLDDFGPRYYSSNMGRFMSPDDVGGHLEDPQTLNLYSYVGNNPLSRTDPSGHDFWQSCDKASATCGNQQIGTNKDGSAINHLVQGTTTDGKFSSTVITSASLGQAGSGNSATVNSSGVQITSSTGTAQGIFINGTQSADIKGSGAGFDQFSFHIDRNDARAGVLTEGRADYLGQGGHQGMVDAINSASAGGKGPFSYILDIISPLHPGESNYRFSSGDYPEIRDYGPSPHFLVPKAGTKDNFHVDGGTGPSHEFCAVSRSCYH